MTTEANYLLVSLGAATATSPWVNPNATTDDVTLFGATARLHCDTRKLNLTHLVCDKLRELISSLELPPHCSQTVSSAHDTPSGHLTAL
jgi:hypothetical protein